MACDVATGGQVRLVGSWVPIFAGVRPRGTGCAEALSAAQEGWAMDGVLGRQMCFIRPNTIRVGSRYVIVSRAMAGEVHSGRPGEAR